MIDFVDVAMPDDAKAHLREIAEMWNLETKDRRDGWATPTADHGPRGQIAWLLNLVLDRAECARMLEQR